MICQQIDESIWIRKMQQIVKDAGCDDDDGDKRRKSNNRDHRALNQTITPTPKFLGIRSIKNSLFGLMTPHESGLNPDFTIKCKVCHEKIHHTELIWGACCSSKVGIKRPYYHQECFPC